MISSSKDLISFLDASLEVHGLSTQVPNSSEAFFALPPTTTRVGRQAHKCRQNEQYEASRAHCSLTGGCLLSGELL